jgi:hypothetical protein
MRTVAAVRLMPKLKRLKQLYLLPTVTISTVSTLKMALLRLALLPETVRLLTNGALQVKVQALLA